MRTMSRRPWALIGVAASFCGCMFVADLPQFDGAKEVVVDGATADVNAPGDEATVADEPAPDQSEAGTGDEAPVDMDATEAATDVTMPPGDEPDVQPVNLISNPSFEEGISPWTTYSDGSLMPTLTTTTAHAHTGSYSGYVTNRTQPFEGTVQDIGVLVVQGQTYNTDAWAMVGYPSDGGDAAVGGAQPVYLTVAVKCLIDGSSMANYTQLATGTATTSGWVHLVGQLTMPTCTTLIAVEIYVAGPAAGVDLYVDDMTVVAAH